MTPAELKTIRESLGLSAQWLAGRAGVRQQRSVQYWEAGRSRVPEDVADLILRIDAQFTEATRQALAVVDEQTAKQGHPPETVRLYRYRDDAALHVARPDMAGLPVTAHAALLARVRLALLARGHAVVIEYA